MMSIVHRVTARAVGMLVVSCIATSCFGSIGLNLGTLSSRMDPAILGNGQQGNPPFPVDNIIVDTATGLEWLNLSFSANTTINVIVNGMGAGGNFDGFRIATKPEILTLVSNAGITLSQFPDNSGGTFLFAQGTPEIKTFIDGFTVGPSGDPTGPFPFFFDGVFVDDPPALDARLGIFQVNGGNNPPANGFPAGSSLLVLDDAIPTNQLGAAFGNRVYWLVREASEPMVPEPNTLVIWSVLVGGSAITRRRSWA